MAGPWEQYKAQEEQTKSEAAPWEKFKTQEEAQIVAAPWEKFKQEEAPKAEEPAQKPAAKPEEKGIFGKMEDAAKFYTQAALNKTGIGGVGSLTEHYAKGVADRGATMLASGVEGISRVTEGLGKKMESALTPEEQESMKDAATLAPKVVQDLKPEEVYGKMDSWVKSLKNYSKDIGYNPNHKLSDLADNPLKVVPFIVERVFSSAPDMLASAYAMPAYVATRTNEILNDRLKNDSKTIDDATVKDVIMSAGAAFMEAKLEQLATKHILGGKGFAGNTATARVGKEVGFQSGTESIEEGIGYLGGALDTKKGVDYKELGANMLEGAIVGGGMGGAYTAAKEISDRKQEKELKTELGGQDAFKEAETYDETRRTIPRSDQLSIPVSDQKIETDTGVGGAGTRRLEGAGETTSDVGVREKAIRDQLDELTTQQSKIAAFDPTDPRVGEIDETIKELKTELDNLPTTETTAVEKPVATISEERKDAIKARIDELTTKVNNLIAENNPENTEEVSALSSEISNLYDELLYPTSKQTALNAPGKQLGFDLQPLEEGAERTVTPPSEFQLTAPAGDTGVKTVADQIVEEPKNTAKMMLVGGGNNPLAAVKRFFGNLKTTSATPGEQVRYKNEVGKLLADIDDFVNDFGGLVASPQEASLRLSVLRNFLDDLSIAPLEKENLTSTLSQRMEGMSAADQASALGTLTSVGNLNTRRGVEELRAKFEQAVVKYERARMGRPLEEAALPYNIDETLNTMDTFIAMRIVKALRELKNTPAKDRTPQQKAAYAYFNPENGWSYALAMRSAAFDVGSKANPTFSSPIFKDQNEAQAKLFKEWIDENLPNQESKRFDATVKQFQSQVKAADMFASGVDARKSARETGLAESYLRIIGRTPSGKGGKLEFGAGLGQFKKPSPVTKLSPYRFYPMHPAIQARISANDLNGALKMMERSGNKFQSALAARLRALNLNTSIVFDQEQSFALSLINANVKAQQTLVFDEILPTTNPEIHAQYFSDLNNIRKVNEGLQAIKSGKVKVDTDAFIGEFNDLVEQYEYAVGVMDASGTYMPHLDAINLNRSRGGASNWSFLHETSHASTQYALDPANFDKLTPKQQQAVVELQKLFDFAKRTGLNEYGFTNLSEFVAEAFSNEEFQKLLESIPYSGKTDAFLSEEIIQAKGKEKPQTIWDKFTRAVMRIFGTDNVLTYTLANANTILQATPAVTKAAIALNNNGWSNSSVLGNKEPNTIPAARRLFRSIDNMLSKRPTWQKSKGAIEKFLQYTTNETRKHYLNGFTLRQLDDIIGHQLPQFKEFIKTAENMLDDRNKTLEQVKDISTRWKNLLDKKETQANAMGDLMIDATLAKVDPDINKSDMLLNERWDALDDDVKQLYREVRDFYKEQMQNYINIVLQNKKDSLLARGFSEEEIGAHDEIRRKYHTRPRIPVDVEQLLSKGYTENEITAHQELQKLEDFFNRHKIEPYFPIRRFGQFSLNVKGRGIEREFSLYETAAERDKAMDAKVKELRGRGLDLSHISIVPRNSLQEAFSTDLQDLEFLKELKDLVKNEQGTTVPEVKRNLDESLEQLYYMLLPDKSFQKSFISRKGTPGMSRDMLRSFATSAFHMSYQHSRFKSSRRFHELLNSADARLTEMEDNVYEKTANAPEVQKIYDNSEGKTPSQIYNEVNAVRDRLASAERQKVLINRDYLANLQNVRLKNLLNPPDTGSWNNFFSSAGFVWYLSAPASAVVEMTAVASMGLPIVGARFGYTETATTMSKYSAKFLKNTRFKDEEGNWQTPSLTNMPDTLNDLQKRAYDLLASEGLFDFTLMHDIRDMRDRNEGLVDNFTSKTMTAVSTPFHVAGKFNREIVGMATFDLAYDRYISKGYTEQAAFRKAVDDAKELTYKALFDYSEINAAPLFQHKIAKPFLMFKKFPQETLMLMFRSFHEWTWREFTKDELHDIKYDIKADHNKNKPGLPPLTDEQVNAAVADYIKTYRSEARKQFIGVFGMSATFFAGITGTPFWDIFKLFAKIYNWMYGEKDEPFDVDNLFKNWCNNTFGSFVGNSISTGVASQLLNIDLHNRMSFAPTDLLFRDVRPGKDATETMMNTIFMLAGPIGGFFTDMSRAYDLFKQGHTERAIETALPAAAKNPLKAYRLATEGAKNVNGVKLIDSFTPYEIAAQAVGFAPERLSRAQKANIETKEAEQTILEKRTALMNAYYLAIQNDNFKEETKVLDKIDKFNDTNPEVAIKGKDLKRSVKAREAAADLAEDAGGISINKKLMGKLEERGRYGREGR